MNTHAVMQEPAHAYRRRIADLHRELGIPADYALQRGLPLCEEATELADIGNDIHQRPRQLLPVAARAWQSLREQAAQEGVTLLVVSAFRSVAYQRDLIAAKLARGEALDAILRVIAAPGYSEHHTGRALDLTAPGLPPLEESFENTECFAWLQAQAPRFGFHLSYPRANPYGFVYEPWHWAYADP
ncbi:MAG TPA: M15 family metallopeptidase [Gammaproteobacteria bacterium]|nr:M15 family metallopeptidase [Gammaproteobacteria bacterium]